MSTFQKKKLDEAKPVCVRLREIRVASGMSIEDMCKKTRLPSSHIRAIEECRFHDLPNGSVYQKNFIKLYLQAAGVNPKPFIQQFVIEEQHSPEIKQTVRKHPHRPYSPLRFQNLPSIIKYVGLVAIIFSVMGYLALQIQHILKPPHLYVFSPENGFITTNGQITIKGESEPEAEITINGQEVTNNDAGVFEQTLDLTPGVNTIIISSLKKHGKTTTETRYITYRNVDHVTMTNAPENF